MNPTTTSLRLFAMLMGLAFSSPAAANEYQDCDASMKRWYGEHQEALTCSQDKDCTAVEGFCNTWEIVNKDYEEKVQKCIRPGGVKASCLTGSNQTKPIVKCVNNKCVDASVQQNQIPVLPLAHEDDAKPKGDQP